MVLLCSSSFERLPRSSAVTYSFATAFFILLLCLASSHVSAEASDDQITQASDLSLDGRLAHNNRLVLVVEFSSASCPYCRLLEDEFLKPMVSNASYQEKVIIRSVAIDEEYPLVGLQGEVTSTTAMAEKYGVTITPTLVFLDSNGMELSKRLVGIWSLDFFGGFIDKRIDSAREKIM